MILYECIKENKELSSNTRTQTQTQTHISWLLNQYAFLHPTDANAWKQYFRKVSMIYGMDWKRQETKGKKKTTAIAVIAPQIPTSYKILLFLKRRQWQYIWILLMQSKTKS